MHPNFSLIRNSNQTNDYLIVKSYILFFIDIFPANLKALSQLLAENVLFTPALFILTLHFLIFALLLSEKTYREFQRWKKEMTLVPQTAEFWQDSVTIHKFIDRQCS